MKCEMYITRTIYSLLLIGAFSACSRTPDAKGLEASRSLGHGYWLVTIAKPVQGGFESLGHFQHCFYNNRDLGQCDRMAPAPSGRFAVYQQANTGLVMIFEVGTGQSKKLTSSFPGLLGSVKWQEDTGRGQFTAGDPPSAQTIDFSF
jgi:hypothetical protein